MQEQSSPSVLISPFTSNFYFTNQLCPLFPSYANTRCQQPWAVSTLGCMLRKLTRTGAFSAKPQRVSRASAVAKHQLWETVVVSRRYKFESFLEIINNNTTHLTTHPKLWALTVTSACKNPQVCALNKPSNTLNSLRQRTERKEFSLQKRLENTLSTRTMMTLHLAELCCICKENNEVNRWRKSSEVHLAFWFIILISSLQRSLSTQLLHSRKIWFGLTCFISIFFIEMPALLQMPLIALPYLMQCWFSVKHRNLTALQ